MSPYQRDITYGHLQSFEHKQTTRAETVHLISVEAGVPVSSAQIFVGVFSALRSGSTFKRALADGDMRRFLGGIRYDDGKEALAVALDALDGHIAYRESLGNSQRGNRAIHAEFLAIALGQADKG